MANELMSVGEAARLLNVDRKQVDRWLKSGKLVAVSLPTGYRRTGKWRYVRRADIERLAADTSWRKPRRTGEETP